MQTNQKRRPTQVLIDELIHAHDTQDWHNHFHEGTLVDCPNVRCLAAVDMLTEPDGK